jgi:hypothetical protein
MQPSQSYVKGGAAAGTLAHRARISQQGVCEGPPMVFGGRREIELSGTTPQEPGEAKSELTLLAPFRNAPAFIRQDVKLKWR